ncbi:MAG: DUF4019 domain-containing protein [Verrucomicrobiae bacterium]|nr:DUF4019 domain-containing protein [Verrucomicrobiae bacterium]
MKTKALKSSFIKCLCAALLAMVVPAYAGENKADAEKAATTAAQTWLETIDGGNYSKSWDGAAELFQKAVTKSGWEAALTGVRKPLGDLVARKLKSAQAVKSLPGVPEGDYVVMQFETSFANKKSAIETVTFSLEKDGRWKSAGYFIK